MQTVLGALPNHEDSHVTVGQECNGMQPSEVGCTGVADAWVHTSGVWLHKQVQPCVYVMTIFMVVVLCSWQVVFHVLS